tara:strand:+ start:183 stop:326 length:144 start_codon:yes stop_codon:yes gene_type:complete
MAVRKEARIHISRAKYKKTSQGYGNVKFSTMNKNKRKSFKAYRGQGR